MPEPQQPQPANLISHRWLQEILRAVATGPQRHRDLLGALGSGGEPVYAKTLNATLAVLRNHGLIVSHVLRERPRAVLYVSTPLGLELLEILERLRHFFTVHEAELKPRTPDDPE